MKTLLKVLPLILIVVFGCTRKKEPAAEIKAAVNLTETEIDFLNTITEERDILPRTKLTFEPAGGLEPRALLMGANQPDLYELDYKDRQRMAPFSVELRTLSPGDYEDSIFEFSSFQPGKINGKNYFLPFRLQWPALLYNAERVPEPPQDLEAFSALCAAHPGGLGLVIGEDHALLEFMLSTVWAFNGNAFDLEDQNTKKALYFFSSMNKCLSPYSKNYDSELLAGALARGEVEFAFAGMDAARELWKSGAYPYPVRGLAFPGRGKVAFTGSYLAVNKNSKKAQEAFQLGFYLSGPVICGKIIEQGLWLCGLPGVAAPPESRQELFAPYLAGVDRLRPAPPEADFEKLARVYRRLFLRIAFDGQSVELVGADLGLELKLLEQTP